MRKIYILMCIALGATACNKAAQTPDTPISGVTTLTATSEDATKTYLDHMSVMWTAGDAINLFSYMQSTYSSNKFATEQGGKNDVVFKGEGGIAIDENAFVLYPYNENASIDAQNGNITTSFSTIKQKLYPDTFAEGLNVAVGKCAKDRTVAVKSVGSLLKFKLTQEGADTLSCIIIKSNGNEPIAVDGAASIDWNDGNPTVTPSEGATTSNMITLLAGKGTFEKDSTYYVWMLPGNYSSGITITLIGKKLYKGVKTGSSALNIARNSIVDLDEIKGLNFELKGNFKTLTFDFSTCPEGWPSGKDEYKSLDHTEKTHTYVLESTNYEFTSATCLNIKATSTRSICWGYDGTSTQEYFVMQSERYFGLPKIEGWKLVTVKFTQACSNNERKACITTAIANQSKWAEVYAIGGYPQFVGTNNTEYAFYLPLSEANYRYYLAPTARATGFATMTLVYEQI